ncbi:MAG: TetR/AcrR family transcriptional regulator [Myxococcota bacterium]
MIARARRTQEERRAESRDRLLDAALECLAERGHAGTTVAEVSKRAGLSIGCQQYHFPTKADLLVATMERMFEQRRARFMQALEALPEGPDRAARGIELLWEEMKGDAFAAHLELVVASRTDPELRRHLRRLGDRMGDDVRRTFDEIVSLTPALAPYAHVLPALTFSVLEGLALGRMATPHPSDIEDAVRALQDLSRQFFGSVEPRGCG